MVRASARILVAIKGSAIPFQGYRRRNRRPTGRNACCSQLIIIFASRGRQRELKDLPGTSMEGLLLDVQEYDAAVQQFSI